VRRGHRLTFSNFQQESKADPFSKSRCDPDNLFSIPTFIPTLKWYSYFQPLHRHLASLPFPSISNRPWFRQRFITSRIVSRLTFGQIRSTSAMPNRPIIFSRAYSTISLLRVSEKNKYARLRRILVRMQGASTSAY
jgi:hypothetical protein